MYGNNSTPILTKIVSITYNQLVTLKNNSKLIPGQQYRITDYTCTTTQSDTQSARNVFDIIVTADNTNTLNENAKAIQHSDESSDYFYGQNLSAWELKYCIDNDTNRFGWANSASGKGVIYWLKDEYDNECGYDFKNIQMKFYKITAIQRTSTDLVGTYSASRDIGNTGAIDYDYIAPSYCTIDGNDFEWRYTFDLFTDNTHKDYSLNKYSDNINCCDNKINVLCDNTDVDYIQKQYINIISFRNIVVGEVCYSNKFGDKNYNFSFGSGCYYNSFGVGCYKNSFVDHCHSNSFGIRCYNNSFGSYYHDNSFGNFCYLNSFGNPCYYNSFGNGCSGNKIKNNCNNNSFGNYCHNIRFENNCSCNSFGNDCSASNFGDECSYNSFGNGCFNNTFAANTQYAIYGNGNAQIQVVP